MSRPAELHGLYWMHPDCSNLGGACLACRHLIHEVPLVYPAGKELPKAYPPGHSVRVSWPQPLRGSRNP